MGNGGRAPPVDRKDINGDNTPQIKPSHSPHSIPAKNTGKCIKLNHAAILCPPNACNADANITPNAHNMAVVTILSVLKVVCFFAISISVTF